ncbi:unnamed protein product [Acanthoscelides obtectus]|uniref:BTB domain-containing protein n=1 Tax=Acanthoscelides obtectus TaxID=200917 RepID=A0A9P0PFV0_ACAOB|nr:unnamed protein product [Acanthoscelides obtectus]CAK1676236.1 hypothetical protein AOBTE_LOCUS30662 [Acanthoscelides obtectus]
MGKICYCDDLYTAYKEKKLTNLTLICAPDIDGTSTLEVHRLVLGCASQEILDKISANDRKVVLHVPYTVSTMQVLIELAYGREVAIPPDMVPQLQEAAIVLKMNNRIKSYIEKIAKSLEKSSDVLDDDTDEPNSQTSMTSGDGDNTSRSFQENETTAAGSRGQASQSQNSVMIVPEKVSVVVIESSSDEELDVTSQRKSSRLIKTKGNETPEKGSDSVMSPVISQYVRPVQKQAQKDSEKTSQTQKEIGTRETSSQTESHGAERNIDQRQASIGAVKKTVSGKKSKKNVGNPPNIGPSSSAGATSSGSGWCSKAVSNIRSVPQDPVTAAVEEKLLDLVAGKDGWPEKEQLRKTARLIEVMEFKRLENLCEGCFKFHPDIKGHVKQCLKKFREPRKKVWNCKHCGTPFSHEAVLNFHKCKDKLPEVKNIRDIGYDDKNFNLC